MSGSADKSQFSERLKQFFRAVNIAAMVMFVTYSLFFISYALTHMELIQQITVALANFDFIGLQQAVEAIASGVLSVTGWVRLAIGFGLVLLSFLFIINTAGIVFLVFVKKAFSAGGTPTKSSVRRFLSNSFVDLRLLFFIALYKITGLQGFAILQEFFQNNLIASVGFFLSSATSFGSLVVLFSVIKLVVYETYKFEYIMNQNKDKVIDRIEAVLAMWKRNSGYLDAITEADNTEFSKGLLTVVIPTFKDGIDQLERAKSELEHISEPSGIITSVRNRFIAIIIMQVLTDIVFAVGWGTILQYLLGWIH